jgi:IclR family KDG regulon transcriptional repressor
MNEFSEKNTTPYRAPSVARAFAALRLLAGTPAPLGVSEIARSLVIGKSSAHGILQALEAEGAVRDAGGKKYRLGPLLRELARSSGERLTLTDVCGPHLASLAVDTGWTALVAVPDQGMLRIEAVREAGGSLRVGAAPGMRVPLLAGATGKVYLAWGPDPAPASLPAFTSRCIVDQAAMAAELERTRNAGVAYDRGEYIQGVAAAAAPILGGDGRLLAVLYAVGFLGQVAPGRLEEIGRFVRDSALSVAIELGA